MSATLLAPSYFRRWSARTMGSFLALLLVFALARRGGPDGSQRDQVPGGDRV